MEITPSLLPLLAFAYLAGSVSSAIVVSRMLGLPDPRSGGSRNPGATNVLRLGGRKAAALTLVGDMAKGAIPVLAAQAWGLSAPALALVGLAAVLGHLYPVFFGFQGGKGVATGLGVLLAACWPVGAAVIGTWLVVFAGSRISSLSALTAFLLAPLYAWWLQGEGPFVGLVAALSAVLIWRHRSNIRNLVQGKEGAFRG